MVVDLKNLSLEDVRRLNDLSVEIKKDFHDLLDTMYNDLDCNIDWLLNSVLSRNNNHSNLFIDLCELELIRRILKVRIIRKIVVNNRAQKSVLIDFCRMNKLDIELDCHESIWFSIKIFSLPFKNLLENLIKSIK